MRHQTYVKQLFQSDRQRAHIFSDATPHHTNPFPSVTTHMRVDRPLCLFACSYLVSVHQVLGPDPVRGGGDVRADA
jgi:hypothetical protein